MPNIPTRQNNPGDLKANGQIATYASPAQGQAALYNDLTAKMTGTTTSGLGPSSTLVDFAKTYAPDSDGNNSLQYAANLANQLGVSPDTQIGSLLPRIDDFAKAVAHNEGYQGQMAASPSGGININSAQASTGSQNTAPESTLQKAGDVAGAVGNFLFPVASDIYDAATGKGNGKTALQVAGDTAMSVLPFVPGLGEVGEAAKGADALAEGAEAAKGSGILSKVGSLAADHPIASGALSGYGTGVASNLQQGQSLGQSLNPLNLQNVISTSTGGVAGAVFPKLAGLIGGSATESGALKAVQDNLSDEMGRTVPGRTLMSNLPAGGKRAVQLIASSGAIPEVSGNNFAVDDAIDKLQGRIGQLGQARASAIEKVAPTTALDDLAAAAKAKITSAPEDATDAEKHLTMQRTFSGEAQNMSSKIDKIVADIKATTGKTELTAPELEAFKEAQMSNSGIFKRTGAIGDENAASLLGGVAKDKIENLANEAGFPGMKEYNQYIKDHYDSIKVLQRLGKQTIKGGRLGNMLRSHTMGLIGAAAGAPFGGGLVGSLVGGAAGEGAGHVLSKVMGDTSISNPLRDKILEKIQEEDPQVVQQLMKFAGKTGKVAPIANPKSASKLTGLISPFLTTGAIESTRGAKGILGNQ